MKRKKLRRKYIEEIVKINQICKNERQIWLLCNIYTGCLIQIHPLLIKYEAYKCLYRKRNTHAHSHRMIAMWEKNKQQKYLRLIVPLRQISHILSIKLFHIIYLWWRLLCKHSANVFTFKEIKKKSNRNTLSGELKAWRKNTHPHTYTDASKLLLISENEKKTGSKNKTKAKKNRI